MRVCLKNTKTFWVLREEGYEYAVDVNGYKTGEKTPIFDQPIEVRLNVYQTNGTTNSAENGTVKDYEYVAFSSDDALEVNDLIFLFDPINLSWNNVNIVWENGTFTWDDSTVYNLPDFTAMDYLYG